MPARPKHDLAMNRQLAELRYPSPGRIRLGERQRMSQRVYSIEGTEYEGEVITHPSLDLAVEWYLDSYVEWGKPPPRTVTVIVHEAGAEIWREGDEVLHAAGAEIERKTVDVREWAAEYCKGGSPWCQELLARLREPA